MDFAKSYIFSLWFVNTMCMRKHGACNMYTWNTETAPVKWIGPAARPHRDRSPGRHTSFGEDGDETLTLVVCDPDITPTKLEGGEKPSSRETQPGFANYAMSASVALYIYMYGLIVPEVRKCTPVVEQDTKMLCF